MSKIKMRCITCGKWFQSANAKEVTCPDCMQKARKEKMASKNAPPVSNKPGGTNGPSIQNRPVVPPPPKPKPVQSGTAHWLDTLEDVKVGQPDQPPTRPKLPTAPPAPKENRSAPGGFRSPAGPGNYREDGNRFREENRGPGGYRVVGGSGLPGTAPAPRPRQPMEGGPRGPRPDRPPRPVGGPGGQKPRGKGKPVGPPRPPAPPKPKREKTPPPLPFTPTPEQVTQVEERYIELATPSEFDGIRTQIAREVGIPKKAVKKIIKELRDRQGIPSWWELQTYKGSAEELEQIKNAYLPLLLPVPPVGVHKQIAEQLELKAGIVYQAIKAIRLEMNLPQYNDPFLHGPDFVANQKSNGQHAQEEKTESSEETPVTQAESDVKDVEATTPRSEITDTIASTTAVVEEAVPSEAETTS